MNFKTYKYVVAGSGFFGAVVAERIASKLKQPVLIVEKRNHTGGNCYSKDHAATGIHYHPYGTHIFHTSNELVWEYINRFTDFNGYHHQVLTTYNNKVYQMPINLETINSFYNLNLKPFEVVEFIQGEAAKSGINNPQNFEEKAISLMGQPLYDAFIRGYSIKQWGCDPKQIPSSILKRLPFRSDYNESYFFDPWQSIPTHGYAFIFDKLLKNPLIKVELGCDFFHIKSHISENALVIYSGPIDRLFSYKFGRLTWRRLSFKERVKNVRDFQGTSVMNYAEESVPYTRIHEPRHLHPERDYPVNKSLVIQEYSHADNGEDPYYPLGGDANTELLNKYKAELQRHKNLIVGGRLGDYKYYDMDQTIASALDTFEKIRSTHDG